METLVRGYITRWNQQISYYFENTAMNIANFIFQNADEECEIRIDTIFGRTILSYSEKEKELSGKERYTKDVAEYLKELKENKLVTEKIEYLDLDDLNGRDEFDCPKLIDQEIERYISQGGL